MSNYCIRHIRLDSAAEARKVLESIGVDPYGIEAMLPKLRQFAIRIDGATCKMGNILKQEMLSLGGDAAVARGSVGCTIPRTDVLLMGTQKQLQRLQLKLSHQPFSLRELGADIGKLLDRLSVEAYTWQTARRNISFGQRTFIMGILNVTPDSFSDGGSYLTRDKAVEHGLKMAEAGADMIDVGGESSRPGSDPVSTDEELRRVIPVIEELAKRLDIPISVDTIKAAVAMRALDAGCEIINDISAMQSDQDMLPLAESSGAGVVLMHMRGRPKTMQTEYAPYGDVTAEVYESLCQNMAGAAEAGIGPERLVIDPGIGFGKSMEDNLALLKRLPDFKGIGRPILVGVSRKAFIGRITSDDDATERREGTAAAVTAAIMGGASIVRVHDVPAMKKAAAVADAIRYAGRLIR